MSSRKEPTAEARGQSAAQNAPARRLVDSPRLVRLVQDLAALLPALGRSAAPAARPRGRRAASDERQGDLFPESPGQAETSPATEGNSPEDAAADVATGSVVQLAERRRRTDDRRACRSGTEE